MNYNRDPRRLFWYVFTVMFILIGIAAVLSAIFNPHTCIRCDLHVYIDLRIIKVFQSTHLYKV